MFFLYSLLLTVGFFLMLPLFILRSGKYAAGFRQRLGALPNFDCRKKKIVWLHCVSVGETNAARPLVSGLLAKYPNICLVVSTTTKTGQNLAREIFKDSAALVFYFPFDWRFSVRRALRKIRPDVVLIMETELWFNFLREAHRSGAKIAIVNGRLSERSIKRYLHIKKFMQRVLHYIDKALMQGSKDAQRLVQLGMRGGKVKVTGNLKFDQPFDNAESALTASFRQRFDVSANSPLIVAASTHAPEESLILDAFKTVWKNSTAALPRLMLVPRHPERFDEVAESVKKSGFDWARRSEASSNRDKTAEVILLDSIGELRAILPLAEIVFVGGSLIPHGGQNILEPAAARKAIVTGHYTMNFAEIIKEFTVHDALVQLPPLGEKEVIRKLAEVFTELLQNAEKRRNLSENAFSIMQKNCGATDETIKSLRAFFETEREH